MVHYLRGLIKKQTYKKTRVDCINKTPTAMEKYGNTAALHQLYCNTTSAILQHYISYTATLRQQYSSTTSAIQQHYISNTATLHQQYSSTTNTAAQHRQPSAWEGCPGFGSVGTGSRGALQYLPLHSCP